MGRISTDGPLDIYCREKNFLKRSSTYKSDLWKFFYVYMTSQRFYLEDLCRSILAGRPLQFIKTSQSFFFKDQIFKVLCLRSPLKDLSSRLLNIFQGLLNI